MGWVAAGPAHDLMWRRKERRTTMQFIRYAPLWRAAGAAGASRMQGGDGGGASSVEGMRR